MKRLTSVFLLTALLGAGPASAMRAHDYLDADQRGKVTLHADRPLTPISVTQPLEAAAAPSDEAQLPTPEQQRAQATAAPPVVSSVPEPSGLAMLAGGLVLLLLVPYTPVPAFSTRHERD